MKQELIKQLTDLLSQVISMSDNPERLTALANEFLELIKKKNNV